MPSTRPPPAANRLTDSSPAKNGRSLLSSGSPHRRIRPAPGWRRSAPDPPTHAIEKSQADQRSRAGHNKHRGRNWTREDEDAEFHTPRLAVLPKWRSVCRLQPSGRRFAPLWPGDANVAFGPPSWSIVGVLAMPDQDSIPGGTRIPSGPRSARCPQAPVGPVPGIFLPKVRFTCELRATHWSIGGAL